MAHAKALPDVWTGTLVDVAAYWRGQKLLGRREAGRLGRDHDLDLDAAAPLPAGKIPAREGRRRHAEPERPPARLERRTATTRSPSTPASLTLVAVGTPRSARRAAPEAARSLAGRPRADIAVPEQRWSWAATRRPRRAAVPSSVVIGSLCGGVNARAAAPTTTSASCSRSLTSVVSLRSASSVAISLRCASSCFSSSAFLAWKSAILLAHRLLLAGRVLDDFRAAARPATPAWRARRERPARRSDRPAASASTGSPRRSRTWANPPCRLAAGAGAGPPTSDATLLLPVLFLREHGHLPPPLAFSAFPGRS